MTEEQVQAAVVRASAAVEIAVPDESLRSIVIMVGTNAAEESVIIAVATKLPPLVARRILADLASVANARN